MTLTDLSGAIALVTGGASGIGAATCRRLADSGATVVVADVDEAGATAVADDIGGVATPLDVTDPAAWRATIDAVVADHGRLDLAHLNAGLHPGISDPLDYDDETYLRHRAVNVDGVFFGLRESVRAMRAQEPAGGSIVITASLASLIAYPIDPVYNLTKHAVLGLMRGVAPVAGPAITVNTVNPGIVDTPMLTPDARALMDQIGLPAIDPAVIADTVVEAATGGGNGEAWVVQVGRVERFRFPSVPGPRTDGDPVSFDPSRLID